MDSTNISRRWHSGTDGAAGTQSWWKRISAFLMAAVLAIAGAVISPGAANALEGDYGAKFTAHMEPTAIDGINHHNRNSQLSMPIVLQDYHKWDTDDGAVLAFCFNMDRDLPPTTGLVEAQGLNHESLLPNLTRKAADGDLWTYAEKPLNNEIDRPVIDIIYNADRVGSHYGLEEWEINMVTQQAIWHYTDSYNPDKVRLPVYRAENGGFSDPRWYAYATLIEADNVPNSPGLIEAPSDVVLDIYEAAEQPKSFYGKTYQNILSTTLRKPNGEEITPPSLKTFAHGQTKDDKTIGAEGGTITDIVTYSGLDTSKEYTIEGKLMVRGENGEPVETGITGKSEAFTPEDHLGETTVEFELSAEQAAKYMGKTLVVYETLISGGKEVAKHHDINDDDQAMTVGGEEAPKGSSSGWWGWILGLLGIGAIGSSVGGSSEGSSGSSGGSSHKGSSGSSHVTETPREEIPVEETETPREAPPVEESETPREEPPVEESETPRADVPEQNDENQPEQAEATTTAGLANTGANVVGVVIAALVFIAVGGLLFLRRRNA